MVLKRPYAFLIKHFQKIHALLLILCGYIFYKNQAFSSFVSDYILLGTYDEALDSVHHYASILFYIVVIAVILISLLIIYLLRYKKKPYRFYVFLILEYVALLLVFLYGANYFQGLQNGATSITTIMAIRDLLFIFSLPQYLIFILLILRVLGVDLKKFGFQEDRAFLGLEEKDNEEFEFQVQVDKDRYKRAIKKQLRFLKYFYQEHQTVVRVIGLVLFIAILGYSIYFVQVKNKIYHLGERFVSNGYSIQVNAAYVTDKDFKGDFVLDSSSKRKFVILDVSVTNESVSRTMTIDRFHLQNGVYSTVNTQKYNQRFQDLGTPYEKAELPSGSTQTFLLIYQVPSSLENDHFVLTYQDIQGRSNLSLKKVKLKVTDLGAITLDQEKKMGEDLTVTFPDRKKKIVRFVKSELVASKPYYFERCLEQGCSIVEEELTAPSGNMLLVLSFVSDDFTTSELVDFSKKYGTINYIDNKGEEVELPINLATKRSYQGNYLYLLVKSDLMEQQQVDLEWTVRNRKLIYHLK